MKIRFLNLSVQSKKELEVHTKIYKKFLKQGNFVLGPSVDKFESKISRIVKKKYTIGCSSGTNAIYLALKSIGIKKGDHVLVPSLSWVSTFTAVKMLGAEPIGVDIDDDFIIKFEDIKKGLPKKLKRLSLYILQAILKRLMD